MAYFYNDKKASRRKKWRAVVCYQNRRFWLGYFLTKEEAIAYEQRFRKELISG